MSKYVTSYVDVMMAKVMLPRPTDTVTQSHALQMLHLPLYGIVVNLCYFL